MNKAEKRELLNNTIEFMLENGFTKQKVLEKSLENP